MGYYLFDFDGTLVDSMPVFAAAMVRVIREEGVPYPEDIVKIVTPLGINGGAKYYVTLGAKSTEEQLKEKMTEYMRDGYFHRIPAKKHVPETLRAMKARGDRLFVLTASPHLTLDACLKRLGLYDLFEKVWSCEDFGTTKADPEIYRMAAREMGAAPEDIWFLDDNINADKTAKSAGLKVCGVFDESSREFRAEMERITDRYIEDFEELPEE